MEAINKINAGLSIVYYSLGAFCLVMFALLARSCVYTIASATKIPEALFTNKVAFLVNLSIMLPIALMVVSFYTGKLFFNLGLYHWKIAFKKGDEE